MIKLNIQQALNNKGIQNTNKFLHQCQIPYSTASRLLNNNVDSISFKYLEKICLQLHCTIDDLFIWIPDENNKKTENHPLYKLVQKEENPTNKQLYRSTQKSKGVNHFLTILLF